MDSRTFLSPTTLLAASLALCTSACGTPAASSATDAGMVATTSDLAGDPRFDRTITLPTFTIAPGQEKTQCSYVPSDNVDRWINSFEITMAPGSHHLLAYVVADDGSPARGPMDCNLGLPTSLLPGAQIPHSLIQLDPGMAMKFPAGSALWFQEHYINATTSDTITAEVTYTMHGMLASDVKVQAGELFYGIWTLNIPTGKSVSQLSCKAPSDFNLLFGTGHMHKHGTAFDATVAGQNIYHTDNWDQPVWTQYPAPGYPIKENDIINWACTYDNETGAPLHFGDSAATNEMCILTGIYYPAVNSQTLFLCEQ